MLQRIVLIFGLAMAMGPSCMNRLPAEEPPLAFGDRQPQRYALTARASQIDPMIAIRWE